MCFAVGAGPALAGQGDGAALGILLPDLFVTSERCMACHNGLVSASGEDVSLGTHWRSSMMANSARDPYWQASLRREVMDHPSAQEAIEHECAACHMPMTRYQAKAKGLRDSVFTHLPFPGAVGPADLLATDGVSCTLCHQIEDTGLGTPDSFSAGFSIDLQKPTGERVVFGPYEVDQGLAHIMKSASDFRPQQKFHIQSSEFCASCHTLFTHALGPNGQVVGDLPEQVPYLEWRHSAYRDTRACQDCHMKSVEEETPISSVLGEPRFGFSRHSFRGGNFFVPRMLNRYRNDLSVVASELELDTMVRTTLDHLQTETASLHIQGIEVGSGRIELEVLVKNLAGHKLPTAYPSRRAWIHIAVRDKDGKIVFESGALKENGAIEGNDNDNDRTRYENHYREINRSDQVQIYEAVLGDPQGTVTTGLLKASQYLKDSRLLPLGFVKSSASPDISVKGRANEDPDFGAGSDAVKYGMTLDLTRGPFSVRAELRYQPISFRWAHNLRSQQAGEIDRFASYYESMARSSSTVLAHDSAVIP